MSEKVFETKRGKVVILGAGLGGLSAGWLLARTGYQVTVFEKSDVIGGLAATKERDGFHYDLGPHNIHTSRKMILNFIQRNFATFFEHFPDVSILRKDRRIPYPIAGLRILTSMAWFKVPLAAAGFLFARVRIFLSFEREEKAFSQWVINRFGWMIYREYFYHYPIKVWGLHPNEIDREVADRRIPVTDLANLIRALLGRASKNKHEQLPDHNYYLRNGIGEIAEFFAKGIAACGGQVFNRVELKAVRLRGKAACSLEYEREGQRHVAHIDFLLSTIPIPSFFSIIEEVPQEVQVAAQSLGYCATVLIFLKLKQPAKLPTTLLYLTDKEALFSRVSDATAFSPTMVPDGKGLFCAEFPCSEGDKVWNQSESELSRHVIEVLVNRGVLNADIVEGHFSERINSSYPRFKVNFRSHFNRCVEYLGTLSNVVTYGRQGGFAYVNTDSVMEQGFNAASAVQLAQPLGMTAQQYFARFSP